MSTVATRAFRLALTIAQPSSSADIRCLSALQQATQGDNDAVRAAAAMVSPIESPLYPAVWAVAEDLRVQAWMVIPRHERRHGWRNFCDQTTELVESTLARLESRF